MSVEPEIRDGADEADTLTGALGLPDLDPRSGWNAGTTVRRGPKVSAAAPPRHWTGARVRHLVARSMILFGVLIGLFLAFEFAFTGFSHDRSQQTLLTAFRQRVVTGTYDALNSPVPAGPVALLSIPSLHLQQVVVQGASTQDLKQGPGHLPGTPLPGEFGNAVIEGHRQLYGGPFRQLGLLKPGTEIDVSTGQGRFVYDVSKTETIAPGQSDVVSPTLSSQLTLITSTGLSSDNRLAVVATLHGNPLGVSKRPPVQVSRDELGMQGDTTGLFLAIGWAQLLVVFLLVTGRAYRRWSSRAAAHVVTTPVILALLWLIFENLDRFLPGTL